MFIRSCIGVNGLITCQRGEGDVDAEVQEHSEMGGRHSKYRQASKSTYKRFYHGRNKVTGRSARNQVLEHDQWYQWY